MHATSPPPFSTSPPPPPIYSPASPPRSAYIDPSLSLAPHHSSQPTHRATHSATVASAAPYHNPRSPPHSPPLSPLASASTVAHLSQQQHHHQQQQQQQQRHQQPPTPASYGSPQHSSLSSGGAQPDSLSHTHKSSHSVAGGSGPHSDDTLHPSVGESPPGSSIVKLNVGGRKFMTTLNTLSCNGTQENFLTALVSGKWRADRDSKGYYFVDRNGKYFEPILDFLRTGEFHVPPSLPLELVLREAHFYSIEVPRSTTISDQLLRERKCAVWEQRQMAMFREHEEVWRKWMSIVFDFFWAGVNNAQEHVYSPTFFPSHQELTRKFKGFLEYEENERPQTARAFREALEHLASQKRSFVFDSAIYAALESGSSAICWYLKNTYQVTVKVEKWLFGPDDEKRGDVDLLLWKLVPQMAGRFQRGVPVFRFAWTGGQTYIALGGGGGGGGGSATKKS